MSTLTINIDVHEHGIVCTSLHTDCLPLTEVEEFLERGLESLRSELEDFRRYHKEKK